MATPSPLFDINGDGEDRGYEGAHAEDIELSLRSTVGVTSVLFQVFDSAAFDEHGNIVTNPPRASKGAPLLTLTGATTGKLVAPSTLDGVVTTELPASGTDSWIVRCIVNGGEKRLRSGIVVRDPSLIHERGIFVPSALGVRKVVCTEETQFELDGWAGALADLAETDFTGPTGSTGSAGATGPQGASGALNYNVGTYYYRDHFDRVTGSSDALSTSRMDGLLGVGANSTIASLIDSELDHPGIRRSSFGTSAGAGFVGIAYARDTSPLGLTTHSSNLRRVRWITRFQNSLENLTNTMLGWGVTLVTQIAFGDLGTDGIYFEFVPGTSGNWRGITRAGGVSTVASGGSNVAVVLGTWYVLEAETLDAGVTWNFYVNGTFIGSSTTHIPAALGAIMACCRNSGNGAATRRWDVDEFAFKQSLALSGHDEA